MGNPTPKRPETETAYTGERFSGDRVKLTYQTSMRMNIEKLIDYIGWTFLIVTIVLLKVAEQLLDNIIKANLFLMEYSAYGLILSLTVLYLIYKLQPDYFKSGETKRGSAVLSYFFGVVALFVLGSAKYNLETSRQNTTIINAYVIDHFENYRHKTKYVTLYIDGRTERFQPNKNEWEEISLNDSLILTVGYGQLGYQHIFQFSKKQ